MAEDDTQYLDLAPEPLNEPEDNAEASYLEMEAAQDADAPADEMSYLQMEPADEGPEASYLEMTPDAVIEEGDDVGAYLEMAAADAAQDTGYLAVQPDWLKDQWDLLSNQPWFTGFQSRAEAKQKLDVSPAGSFVTRVSQSQPGHFALSVVQEGKHFDHMLILPSYAGNDSGAPGNTRYRLGTYSRLLFNTVPKLVAYYIGHPYINTSRLIGEVVPEAQEGGYMMVDPENDDDDAEDYE